MTSVVLVVPDLVISFIKRVKRWGGAGLSIFRELLSDAWRELARLSLQHPSLGLSKTASFFEPIESCLNVRLCCEEDDNLHYRFCPKILALTCSHEDPRLGFWRYSSSRLSTSAICSGVIGISSGLDARSSQSSVTKVSLSDADNARSSGILSIILVD